jgi:predicted RNA methylase
MQAQLTVTTPMPFPPPIPPEGFYASAAHISRAALRLLEAGCSLDDRSLVGHTAMADGAYQALFMSDGVLGADQVVRKSLGLATLASEYDVEPSTARPLLDLSWREMDDEIHLSPHRELLELAAAGREAPADTPARIAMEFVEAVNIITGMELRAPGSRHAFSALACHAAVAHMLMAHMKGPKLHQQAPIAAAIMQDVAAVHECFEQMCNRGDGPLLNARTRSLCEAIERRLKDAGIPRFRINGDPRGATLEILGAAGERRLSVVAWPARLLRTQWAELRKDRPAMPLPSATSVRRANADAGTAPTLKEAAIPDHVLEVLRGSRLDGARLILPPNMPRQLYQEVNAAIELAGGKWSRGLGAHVFKAVDAQAKFARMLATGSILDPKDFDFFPTPDKEAAGVVDLAEIEPWMLVAEPSAGRGAIATHLARIVGPANVHVFELLPENAAALRDMGLQVTEGDFLLQPAEPRYDRIVMNPPFGSQADMRHVEHALRMLRPGGRLVAIVSPAFEHRASRQAESFRALLEAAGEIVRELPAGTFRESGTDVRTVIVRFEADRLPWNVETEQPRERMRA